MYPFINILRKGWNSFDAITRREDKPMIMAYAHLILDAVKIVFVSLWPIYLYIIIGIFRCIFSHIRILLIMKVSFGRGSL